ncbi:MAG: cupredoxin domain-containing protein [Nitrospinota bacterium]|nr:cupredoxin domain-containing protein [Nitrospinota bacterium]
MKHVQPAIMAGMFLSFSLLASPLYADEAEVKPVTFKAEVGEDGTQVVEILGGEYFFTPNRIIVKVNIPVVLRVRKESYVVPHNIAIKAPDAGIDFDVDFGREASEIKFTPTKKGEYPMECTKQLLWFKSHKESGMVGVLEVVD